MKLYMFFGCFVLCIMSFPFVALLLVFLACTHRDEVRFEASAVTLHIFDHDETSRM